MSEKTSIVTEELKCDSLVPSISSPLEWLKFGGVEMKFSEKIDLTSETGKLVLQLQESLISKGIEFVQNGLLPAHAHCTRHHHHNRDDSYPRVIQVGLSSWLGSYSGNPAGPFDQFLYYDNLQTNQTRWHAYHTPSDPYAFLISNDLGYHWSYDQRNKRVFLQQDFPNQENVNSNWFHINHNTGSISPHHQHNKLYVYGYGSETPPNPCLFLPVGPVRYDGDELKMMTKNDYLNDGDACNT